MAIRFRNHANPSTVTRAVLVTDEARAAFDDLEHAIREHETAAAAIETATETTARDEHAYAEALRAAAIAGDNLDKVKAPKPINIAHAEAARDAWADKARDAAAHLSTLLPANADKRLPNLLTELEAAERAVRDAHAATIAAYRHLSTLNAERSFHRQAQLFPGDTPRNTLNGNTTPIEKIASTLEEVITAWRDEDLHHRDELNETAIRNTNDPAELNTLVHTRHELVRARNGMVTKATDADTWTAQ